MRFFRTIFKKLMPSWLTEGEGELVHYSLGIMLDAFAEAWRQGVLARFPEYGPPDALTAHERDREIWRARGETDAAFATRLLQWRVKRANQGNPYALLEQVQTYIQAAVRVRLVDANGNWYTRESDGTESALIAQSNWEWDGLPASLWSRFWLIIYPAGGTEPWAITSGTLANQPWGNNLGDQSLCIGVTAEAEHIAKIRTIVRKWQPDGTRCEWIIFSFNSGSFDPAGIEQPSPNWGTWGKWGKLSGTDYVIARSTTHRYARGVQGSEYP